MAPQWSTETALTVQLRQDGLGGYSVEGLDSYPTADVQLGSPASVALTATVRLTPCAKPVGPFALEGLISIKFYVCPPGLEEELVEFERQTQALYYPFMARARWRYGGLCSVRSEVAELTQPFAEVYSILAADKAEAEALDAQTKPEPQQILDMYEACSRFTVKGLGRWVWLTPRA